jgi:methyl-accepting chemotaxis protein
MFRRRNYFIKKKFQLSFFYRFTVLLVIESALVITFFIYISTNTLTTGYVNSALTVKHTANFFFVPFLLIMLTVGVGISIAAMIIFILLSHRIAGPLYRFEKVLNEITSGDLTKRISLRKTDQLNELKEALNILMESFDQRLGRVKNNLSELRQLLAKNDSANSEKIYKAIELLKNEIDHFKVTSSSNRD